MKASEGMSLFRRVFVSVVIFGFVCGSAYDVRAQRDDWPLSDYPMYSDIAGHRFRGKFVKGVSQQGEFALTPAMTACLSEATLRWALDRIGKDEARKKAALQVFKSVYDTQKRTGRHNGPELTGLTIYEEKWQILPNLSNIDHPHRKLFAHMDFDAPSTNAASPATP